VLFLPKVYVVCSKCLRLFDKKKLIDEKGRLECPYCGNTKFVDSFGGAILILDPEKSIIAKKINKSEKGIFALGLE